MFATARLIVTLRVLPETRRPRSLIRAGLPTRNPKRPTVRAADLGRSNPDLSPSGQTRRRLAAAPREEQRRVAGASDHADAWNPTGPVALLLCRRSRSDPVQKILVLLHGTLKRAKRQGWIATNPAEDAERVTIRRTGEFNVLTPEEVHAVARAERSSVRFTSRRRSPACGWGAASAALGPRGLRQASGARAAELHSRRLRCSGVPPRPQRPNERSRRARVDVLSRHDEGDQPRRSRVSPGFNVPFYDDTVRKRFYVALEAGSAACVPTSTPSSSTTCATRSGRWPSRHFRAPT
jgi:hypothetical protein